MKIVHVGLTLIVALNSCIAWAQNNFINEAPPSSQSVPYSSNNMAGQGLTSGPSSPSFSAPPSTNMPGYSPAYSTVYPPANPTEYPSTGVAANPPVNAPVYPPAAPVEQYQNLSGAANAATIPADITMPCLGNRLIESTWYTRVDYFHWNERTDGMDLVNEYGTLFTLGYMRRVGMERFHAAVFGGTMQYKGFGQFDDGTLEPLSSATGYIGILGEYDLHYEPDAWPSASLFVGVGTRFWIRDIKDGMTDFGSLSTGYQEAWWTFYPYLGIENRRIIKNGVEFYGSARIGCTAFTYQHATWGDVALYPKVGLTSQAELGVRGQRAFISIFTETLSWGESDVVRGMFQPNSDLFTIGMKTGFCF